MSALEVECLESVMRLPDTGFSLNESVSNCIRSTGQDSCRWPARVIVAQYNALLHAEQSVRPRNIMTDPHQIEIPTTFETSRLVLQSFRPEHATELHEALVESVVDLRKYLWFLPWVAEEQTLESAQVRCRKAQANFLLRDDLPYLAFEKSTGNLVASIGLHRTDWTLPKTEVGYWSRSSKTGNGYASEMASEISLFALVVLGAKRIELITDEQNIGSRTVAERCGFQLEGVMRNFERSPDGGLRNNCLYARIP